MIGLGLLGAAIGERLRRAGFETIGFDLDKTNLAGLCEAGGSGARSAVEAAEDVPHVLLCLPHSGVSRSVVGEIAGHLSPRAVVIDATTGDPGDAQDLAAQLVQKQCYYLDATVGGSSRQALAGEVIVMVGGDQAAFERSQPIFNTFSRRTHYLGPSGHGARMKLILNLALGLNRAVLAEALSYARSVGIDDLKALDVLKDSPAYSRVMDRKGIKMVQKDFEPEARLAQHLKDVLLILQTAEESGAAVPLSQVHRSLLERACDRGFGAADNSAIIEAYAPVPPQSR